MICVGLLRDCHRDKHFIVYLNKHIKSAQPHPFLFLIVTCSFSSFSCDVRWDTSFMVEFSLSCRHRISFCSPSPSLLTSDIARIRGNQSRFLFWNGHKGSLREETVDLNRRMSLRLLSGISFCPKFNTYYLIIFIISDIQ